jgi:hypothetical protein
MQMVKYGRIAVSAIAALALTGAAAASATAAEQAPLGSTARAAAIRDTNVSVSQFTATVGTAVIRNQEALQRFKAWMVAQPGFARSGYVWAIDNLAHKSTIVLWHGPRTPLLAQIIQEGARRGIRVTVQQRKYSLQQLNAASDAIWKQAREGKWAGFKISTITDITAVENGITVQGAYTAVPAARRAPQVRSLFTTVAGVPVHVVSGYPAAAAVAAAGRDADTAPFNSGGYMAGYYTLSKCSSGFAIWMNGRSYTTTARHCNSANNGTNDYVDRNDLFDPSPPPTSRWYGNTVAISPWVPPDAGGARILGNTGFSWMFNHGYNSTTQSTVVALVDPNMQDLVCTEGGNSGEHCNVKVTAQTSWSDDWGPITVDKGVQQTSGKIAAIQGDSGGPVMTIAGTNTVNAAGMIQAVIQTWQGAQCGAVYDAGTNWCSPTVYFETFSNVLNSFSSLGPILDTGGQH